MQLSLQNFSSLVNTMAATVQGACSGLIDLTVGSVLRAMLEASASVALWLQYLLLQVLTMTRLATSVGADVDSWVQDFGMARLPAGFASGQVTLSSFSSATQGATISNGATVRTGDGSQTFSVVGGPYVRAIGTVGITVQINAVVSGVGGNVQAGVINVLGTAIPGVDTVSNFYALSGGTAAETDAALRVRFITYINTRSQATEQALGYAIMSVQQGLTYSIQENMAANGTFIPGHVNVIVDDGSGHPGTTLLASIAAAIETVRPLGTTISVTGPVVLAAMVGFTLTINGSADSAAVQAEVQAAISTYINGLAVGQALRFSRLAGLCYDADTAVSNVQNVSLDGAVADIGGQDGTVVRAGSITIQAVVG